MKELTAHFPAIAKPKANRWLRIILSYLKDFVVQVAVARSMSGKRDE